MESSRMKDSLGVRLRHLVLRFKEEHHLTEREAEVVELSARGLIAKEVASQLRCSPKTVEEYWRRIYRKCNLSSRQAVMAEVLLKALTLVRFSR